MTSLWLTPLLAAVVALALVPVVRRWAHRIGAVDHPGDLSTHQHPTARLGGAAVWMTAFLSLLPAAFLGPFDGSSSTSWIAMGAAGTAMFLLGLADDLKRMPPWPKLIAATMIALVAARFGWMSGSLTDARVDLLVSTLWIVFFVNAFNALDGLDGLAAGVGVLAFGFLGLWFSAAGDAWSATVSLTLAGAVAGFLVYNFPPSRGIFLGDGGSLFVGFALAVLVMHAMGQKPDAAGSIAWAPVAFVSVPLIDATVTFTRRLLLGRSPLRGDRSHIYDALRRRTGSTRTVVAMYYAITVAVSLAAWFAA